MIRRALLLLVLLAAALVAPAPARAQEEPPGDAVVVAGPTAGGVELVAWGRRGELCLAVRRGPGAVAADCSAVPGRGETRTTYEFLRRGRGAHGGVVAAPAASVQVSFRAGSPREVTTPAAAAPQPIAGVTGSEALRFFLAEGPAQPPWLLRIRDAAGTVLSAESTFLDGPVVGRPQVVSRSRRGGLRLRAVQRRRLAATPLQRDRLVTVTCLMFSGERFGNVCASVDDPILAPLEVSAETRCGRALLPVMTSAAVRRVVAVLGDGRRVRVPLARLVSRPGIEGRAGGLVIRGQVAIRAVEAFGAGGRRVAREAVRTRPAPPCGQGSFGASAAIVIPELGSGERGPLGLSARDSGARLCTTLGSFDPLGRDCGLPPVLPRDGYLVVRRAEGRALVGGVLSAEVASVELTVDGAPQVVATTGDIAGYGGRYRDLVRFLSVELPGAARLGAARFLDTSGAELRRDEAVDFDLTVASTRRVRTGGVWLDVVRFTGGTGEAICVHLAGHDPESCTPTPPDAVVIQATCRPRRLIVSAIAPSGTRSMLLRTTSGTLRARKLRGGPRPLFAAVVPRGAGLRRIVARGGISRGTDVDLPPAARQCGYLTFEGLATSRR